MADRRGSFDAAGEDEENPETAAPKGTWAAMHSTNDTSERTCEPRGVMG